MATMTYTGELVIVTCWCGLPHAIPFELEATHNRTGMTLHCPLGHEYIPQSGGENARLRRQLAAVEESRNRLRAELTDTERSLTATKGQLTRARRRHTNGVCPVCHRSFEALARHVKTKHPDFVAEPL
jgi:septal ring factor EnvC (AmiA/AmiB activator)